MGKTKRKKKEGVSAAPPAPRKPRALLRMDAVLRACFALALLAIILALYPYTQDATGPIKYLLIAWAAFVVALVLAILGTRQKIPWRTPRLLFPMLTAFVGITLIAALASAHPSHAMVTWRRFAALFIVYLAATRVYRKPRHISGLMLVACIGVTLSTLYAIFQYWGIDPFPWESKEVPIYRELPGTFGNPNYAAHTMILCIVMAVFLATRRKTRWAGAFAVLFLIHMYFTGQRGGLVGLAMAAILLLVANTVRKHIAAPRRAVVAALIVTALLVPAGAGLTMAITKARTGIALPLERQLMLRYHAYDGAARMILANPVLGYGPGNYQIENPFFWTLEEQEWFAVLRKMNQHVHNDILEAGVDAGFPGAIVYLLFLVAAMGQGLMLALTSATPDRRRLGWAFAALFCAFLVDGALGFNLRVPVSAFLLFLMAGALDGLYLDATAGPPVPARSRKVLAVRFGLAALALVLAICETRTFFAEKHMQFGRGAFLSNAFTRADNHFERAEKLCPWQWSAPFERAKCALRISQYLESENHPDKAFAMRNKAVEYFERSIQRNPSYVLSLLGTAETNLSLGYTRTEYNQDTRDAYLERASIAAEKANELCPLMPESHDILGRVESLRAMEMHAALSEGEGGMEQIRQQWHSAIGHLKRALDLGSTNQGALYLMLAQAHIGLQELEAAEDALRMALETDPANKDILPVVYRFGTQHNRYDFLRQILPQYIERLRHMAPEEREIIAQTALYMAATEHRIFKNDETAERFYQTAADSVPERAETWAAFAQFSKLSNRPKAFQQAVLDAYRDRVEAGKEPLPQIQAVVSIWQEGSQKLPEATGTLARTLRKALDAGLTPNEARNQFGWPAEVLLVETQKPGVAPANRGIALLNIGSMLNGMDQLPLAATVLKAAIHELPPKQAALAAREASQVLARQNQEKEAFEMLQKAVALDPENPEIRMAYARTLVKRGLNAEAREEYGKLLQMPGLGKEARELIEKEMRALQ